MFLFVCVPNPSVDFFSFGLLRGCDTELTVFSLGLDFSLLLRDFLD